jgi:type IV secretion system protein VirB10
MVLLGATGAGVLLWYYLHVASAASVERPGVKSANNAAASEMKLPMLAPETHAPARIQVSPTTSRADVAGATASESPNASAPGTAAVTNEHSGAPRPAERRNAVGDSMGIRHSSPVLIETPSVEHESSQRVLNSNASLAALLAQAGQLATNADGAGAAKPAGSALGDALVPTLTTPAQASIVPTRRWLIPKGSFLDCTLETAIDSTLPGMTTCVLAVDVFGADGRVVLFERGTKLVGETRSEVRAGQARVSVVWSEARTPTGVVVGLASPGTDGLGRAGVPGVVDTHVGARFGAAVLLSVIDGAIGGVVAHQQGSAGVVYNAQGSRDVATDALRNTIGIPPTINVAPGASIQVLVARDIDFRSVYRLVSHAAP